MDAPGGRSWAHLAPFGGAASFDGHHIARFAYTQAQPSKEQVFLMALTHAIGDCAKKSFSEEDTRTDALEVLKHIGREMIQGSKYASWLDVKVRKFAHEHPRFACEFFPDELCALFLPPVFLADSESHSVKVPTPLKGDSMNFQPAIRLQQAGLGSPHGNTFVNNTQSQGLGLKCPREQTVAPFDGHTPTIMQRPFGARDTHTTYPVQRPRNFSGATLQGDSPLSPAQPPPPYYQSAKHLNNSVQQYHPFVQQPRSSWVTCRELTGVMHAPSDEQIIRAYHAGVIRNSEYRGDLTDLDIANANCPPDQNCAVRIENISHMATPAEIFALIYEGKVFSFSIKEPIPGRFMNCAARLVFTTRAAAEAFVNRGRSWEGIMLHGYRFMVKWNRDACRPQREGERHQSRVLHIRGPQNELSAAGIEALFHTQIKFEAVGTSEWLVPGGKKIVEISFSSILGQSRIAYKYFHELMDRLQLRDRFTVGFGPDPCDPASQY